MLPRILISGFGPFLENQKNISGWLAQQIQNQSIFGQRLHIETKVLPVQWKKSADILIRSIDQTNYDLVLMLGLGKNEFVFEPGAINKTMPMIGYDLQGLPDGILPNSTTIDSSPESHSLLFSWPVQDLQNQLSEYIHRHDYKILPTTHPRQENRYICNDLSYRILKHLEASSSSAITGFLHLPRDLQFDSSNLEFSIELIKRIIEKCLSFKQASRFE